MKRSNLNSSLENNKDLGSTTERKGKLQEENKNSHEWKGNERKEEKEP